MTDKHLVEKKKLNLPCTLSTFHNFLPFFCFGISAIGRTNLC